MKNFLTILFILFTAAGFSQRVYSPSVDGVPGRNQPIGISGLPLDGRSMYHDTTVSPSKWRDYQSTTEANNYLNTATKRTGHFPIYIHVGGSLSAGVWTGGTFVEYQYTGTNDGDLVVKGGSGSIQTSDKFTGNGVYPSILDIQSASNANLIAAIAARFYGDSLTYGTGAGTTSEYPGGVPFMEHLQALTGWNFYNYGVPGQNSTQIRNRLIADSANRDQPTVIWAGTNNLGSISTILSDIAAMVAALNHRHYLIIDLLGQNNSSYWSGTGLNTAIHGLNDTLEARHPGHVIHLRSWLVANYNHSIPADTMAHFHDVWPPSFGADETHLNDAGYRALATLAATKMDTLILKEPGSRVMTTSSLKYLLGNPGVIGNVTPSLLGAKSLGINGGTLDGPYLTEGGGQTFRQPMVDNGGADFYYPGTTNGIRIRPRSVNTSGYPLMEIAGTNGWASGTGMIFNNHVRSVTLGSPLAVTGELSATSTITGGGLISSGRLDVGSAITNIGIFSSVERVLDLQNPGGSLNGGIKIPRLIDSELPGIFAARPGEILYNTTQNRFQFASPHPNITNAYTFKNVATLEDAATFSFSKLMAGAGIGVTGTGVTGNPYIIDNLSLPNSTKLTGTPYESTPTAGNPLANAAKAFDGYDTTRYQSITSNVDPAPFVGMTLDSLNIVLTKIRIRPADGLIVAGAKIQGSNTSTTAGFVDLFTIPSDIPFYQFSTYGIDNKNPYRYIRLLAANPPSATVLAVSELELYGYKVAAPISLTTTGNSGPATLNGSVLNIPQYSGGTHVYTDVYALPDSSGFELVRLDGTRDTIQGSIGGPSGPSGSGTVTSVTQTMPTGFSVSISNATTTPAINVTTALNGLIRANGSGFGTVSIGYGISYNTSTGELKVDTAALSLLYTTNLNVGGNLKITSGVIDLKYGTHLVTNFTSTTYVIADADGSIVFSTGGVAINSGVTPTAVTLPDPTLYPDRILRLRNDMFGSTITLSRSVFFLNGSASRTTLLGDQSIEIQSNGSVWVQIASNFSGS